MSYQFFKEADDMLSAEFKVADFKTAIAFMTEVAFWAESYNHHPNWSNVYNTVEINLTTHDEGNKVTDLDHKLAAKIEELAQKYLS